MRSTQIQALASAPATFLLVLFADSAAAMLDCNKIVASDKLFNLGKLAGPHSVTISQPHASGFLNTTYTTDICHMLKRKGDVDRNEQCPLDSRICAIERSITNAGKSDTFNDVFPVAGDLRGSGGSDLDHKASSLGTSDSNADSGKKGIRLILNGGFHKLSNGQTRRQRAIIEFECDEKFEGNETDWKPEDEYDPDVQDRSVNDPLLYTRADEDSGDDTKPQKPVQLGDVEKQALRFVSWGPLDDDKDIDVLRLTWKTKYACPDRVEDPSDAPASSHWGFFTWIVILVFLGTAAYLIFGSWLNYNRYGARGWDLLPHGDTIRDIPYLMKDWTRNVLNTVQGSGSRGGYSAV